MATRPKLEEAGGPSNRGIIAVLGSRRVRNWSHGPGTTPGGHRFGRGEPTQPESKAGLANRSRTQPPTRRFREKLFASGGCRCHRCRQPRRGRRRRRAGGRGGQGRRAAVPGAPRARAGHGGDQPGPGIDPADRMVLGVDDEEVARGVDREFLGTIEGRVEAPGRRRPSILSHPCRRSS